MRTLLVLPTYNEAGTIAEVIQGALTSTPDVDVLVVDDGSPDRTGEIVERIAAGEPRVRVIHRPAKGGLGPAYLAGFRVGLDGPYDAVMEMDSDLSHDPGDVARLIAAAENADLAIGSRYIPGGGTVNWSRFRRFLSRGGTMYAKALLGLPLSDATSGFRCYRRAVIETVPLERIRSGGYAFQIEMAWRAWTMGFRTTEIPIVFTERREGASKMSRAIVAEALWVVLIWSLRMRRAPRTPHPRSVASRRTK